MYLLSCKSIIYEIYNLVIPLRKMLHDLGGLGPKPRHFIIYQSTTINQNQMWVVYSFTIEVKLWDNQK